MTELKVELWKTLQELEDDKFMDFKWFLNMDNFIEYYPGIPKAELEKAERRDTVNLMVQTYQEHGALKVTKKALKEMNRNDLVQRLEETCSGLKDHKTCSGGDQKEENTRNKPKLESVQQFAVEVTLDPDTAHPALFLSDDNTKVYCSDIYENLPENPKRFKKCVNVLGKQSFSSGRFYYEVQVKGKTEWDLGVAKESIKRKGIIATRPQNGYWTIMLRDEDEYIANDYDHPVRLSVKKPPQKVGVFVDYEEGLVCFYDVDAADLLYAFTKCSFTEELYPFFSPCTIDNGRNSAPLIIPPIKPPTNLKTHNPGKKKKQCQRKMADLESVQKFAVEVTLDHNTAHPNLILSDDGKQVHHGNERKKLPDNPERFYSCVNVLGKQSFSSGRFYYEVQVKGKTEWDLGVAKESIKRKGSIATRPQNGYWTIMLRDEDEYIANDYDHPVRLSLKKAPQKVGVFVDYEEGLVCFYDVDAADLLYAFTECSFTEGLYPFFSPCTNDNGGNSAPLIISPVNLPPNLKTHDSGEEKKQCQRKMADLKSVQQFAVEVTLDPDTAHPALFLSEDRKRVHDGDVWEKLPNSRKRFNSCVNVLGKESFSSGRFYYEVQVKGKTAWTVGVAKESIERKGQITLSPENGFWTIWLRNGDKYSANDENPFPLSLKKPPQKVGVLVDYEEGLVCFYDVDAADLLYAFTECSFTEGLYPFFSPCTNDKGRNSAPLIISPVNLPPNLKTHDSGEEKKQCQRQMADLKSVQQFAVEVTLDHNTAHPNLILSDDGKQVHHGNERKKLPDNPERFNSCVNVLGKESFSSGRFYYEVQVKGKTAWTVGVAKESIERKGKITLSPEDGFWTIWLRKGDKYSANDENPFPLSLKKPPQKVGVLVDYEEGLVCFYDVDAADLLYAFTECSFTEELYPYFSPCTNDKGRNSAPLIISPVNHTD